MTMRTIFWGHDACARSRRMRRGLSRVALAVVAASTVTIMDTGPAHAAGEGEVWASPFNSAIGSVVQIRKGGYDVATGKGYGNAKICLKHNLCSVDALRWLYSSTAAEPEGSYWQVRAFVRRYVDGQLESEVELLGVFNPNVHSTYYGYEVGGKLGAMTAYCVGHNPTCPSWVSEAAAQSWATRGVRASEPRMNGESFTASFRMIT